MTCKIVPDMTYNAFGGMLNIALSIYLSDGWPTQPSIPPGSVNEYQLRVGRQRQVWFILLVDVRGVCR